MRACAQAGRTGSSYSLPLLRAVAIPALVISTELGAVAASASASTLGVARLVTVLVAAVVSLLPLSTVIAVIVVVVVVPALRVVVVPVVVTTLAAVPVVVVAPVPTTTRPLLLLRLTRSHGVLTRGKNVLPALWQIVTSSEKVNLQSKEQQQAVSKTYGIQ